MNYAGVYITYLTPRSGWRQREFPDVESAAAWVRRSGHHRTRSVPVHDSESGAPIGQVDRSGKFRAARNDYAPNAGGYYVTQGMYDDGRVVFEATFEDEVEAIHVAQKILTEPWFEGDSTRVITIDGEFVWDSEADDYAPNSFQLTDDEKARINNLVMKPARAGSVYFHEGGPGGRVREYGYATPVSRRDADGELIFSKSGEPLRFLMKWDTRDKKPWMLEGVHGAFREPPGTYHSGNLELALEGYELAMTGQSFRTKKEALAHMVSFRRNRR